MVDVEHWQRALNQQTAGSYASFAGHRQHVMSLLGGRARGLRLCVLGAGNCNDVDLVALLPRFREVVLVDVDAETMTRATEQQPAEVRGAFKVRAPLDFSGLDRILKASDQTLPISWDVAGDLARAIDPAPFDIVCSTCVLSQLIDQARARLEEEPERCLEAVQSVREIHLTLMLRLLRPGGRGIFVSDMVSSDTAPEITSVAPTALAALMARLVGAKNFFTGLNPFVIEGLLKQDPRLAPAVAQSAFHLPWVWQLGAARSYLTFAISFQRA
jgi:hypothetical protein